MLDGFLPFQKKEKDKLNRIKDIITQVSPGENAERENHLPPHPDPTGKKIR